MSLKEALENAGYGENDVEENRMASEGQNGETEMTAD